MDNFRFTSYYGLSVQVMIFSIRRMCKHKRDFNHYVGSFTYRKKPHRICLLKSISKDVSQFHLFYFKTKPILRIITSDTMRKISSLQELSVLRWTWANCKSHHPGTTIWCHFPFKESHINGRSAFHYPSLLMATISPRFHWLDYIELIWECITGLLKACTFC